MGWQFILLWNGCELENISVCMQNCMYISFFHSYVHKHACIKCYYFDFLHAEEMYFNSFVHLVRCCSFISLMRNISTSEHTIYKQLSYYLPFLYVICDCCCCSCWCFLVCFVVYFVFSSKKMILFYCEGGGNVHTDDEYIGIISIWKK